MQTDIYEYDQEDTREKQISSRQAFGRLIPFLKEHFRGLIICLVFLLGATGMSLAWPILLKRAVDVNIANNDFNGLLLTVVVIGLMQCGVFILQYVQRIKLETIGQSIMVRLKRKLFNHILSLKVSFFDKNPVGKLMARIESDTEALRMLFTNTVVLIVGDLFMVLGIYAIMFNYSWRLALILSLVFPLFLTLTLIFERKTTPRFLEVRKRMAYVTASLAEFLHGMSIVQIFNRGDYVRGKLDYANLQKFRHDRFVNIAVVLYFNTIFFFEYVMVASVLYFGVLWVQTGTMTVGTIGMFIILIWKSFEPVFRASEQLANIQKAVAGAKRIFALLSNDDRLVETENPVEWKGLKESIRFENVWFSYKNDDNWALRDVSFELKKGKSLALAGVTGGGKTTVISLLLRFYDPQKGRITVDGIDIRDLRIADLRRKFALVLQDIHLFPCDVRENIALKAEEITDERIVSAARVVGADSIIKNLPNGYKTEVSEKGANFSRGERQLLSFARALVTDPEILLLDEATSSVDPETEQLIQQSLKTLMAGRTSLVIAHRLSTILDVDQILVIRRGEIIERGTHTDLILADGYYAKLFHLQFKHADNGVIKDVG